MKNFSTDHACVACGRSGNGTTCYHHLYTKRVRRDLQYTDFNLIPVCMEHHAEFHNKGTFHMAEKYDGVSEFLIRMGWLYDDYREKYYHPKAQNSL